MTDALVKATATLEFSEEQRKLIRDSFANGATETEFGVLMEVAKARRLNPLLQQIHFVKRWNSQRNCEVWSTQVGIDGLRAIAERTGKYDGQDEPEFERDAKGVLKCCRVRVYRKDISRAFVGVAHFGEYAQTKRDGSLTNMWATKPHIMLAKCAEALALRKGFPEDMAGLYVPEEMALRKGFPEDMAGLYVPEEMMDKEERELNPPPPSGGGNGGAPKPVQSRVEQVKAKLKAGPVVDVKEGETEAEATARTAAEKAKPTALQKRDENTQALLELSVMRENLAFTKEKMASVVSGATGKTDWTRLTLADVEKVKSAMEALMSGGGQPSQPAL